MTTVINGQLSIRLQCYGYAPAIAYGDVKPGDVLIYNFGETSTVKAIEPVKSGKSVKITMVNKSGAEYTFLKSKTTVIGIKK